MGRLIVHREMFNGKPSVSILTDDTEAVFFDIKECYVIQDGSNHIVFVDGWQKTFEGVTWTPQST